MSDKKPLINIEVKTNEDKTKQVVNITALDKNVQLNPQEIIKFFESQGWIIDKEKSKITFSRKED